MSFPAFTADAAVTVELITYRPWATGETLNIGDVLFGDETAFLPTDGRYRLSARVELPDEDDDPLLTRARGRVGEMLLLLRQALPSYKLELGSLYRIEKRGRQGGVVIASLPAAARIVQPVPLQAHDLALARVLAGAFEQMNDTQKRRLQAAAYWLQQSDAAPDAAQRTPAACFAIEAGINASGRNTAATYLRAVEGLGIVVAATDKVRLKARVERILEVRANILHHGKLDTAAAEPHIERWARDLATAIVRARLGLGPPIDLAIIDDRPS